MSKTPIVYAQQRWEYLELTRKTESYLVNELNQLGEAGWELVTVINHVEAKSGLGSSNVWTAFLKRPHSAHAPTASTQEKPAAATAPTPTSGPGKQTASESPEVFGLKS